jgi:hypothetical protein
MWIDVDKWRHVSGFKFLEAKNNYLVFRYKGGSVRDLYNLVCADQQAQLFQFSFIVFGRCHRWSFDYIKSSRTLHLYRLSNIFGLEKKKCKKTSRFFGVMYQKAITSKKDWIAFHYKIKGSGKRRRMIARYTREREAAVAHDAFMLWWGLKGLLNYKRLKRPVDIEELSLYITPKEQFMSGIRPDCYACAHHKELPCNARIECRADGAKVEVHPIAYRHGWFDYPFKFDPLWLQSCDKFCAKGGIQNE